MPGDEDKSLIWVTIEDFTPGIITNTEVAYAPLSAPDLGPVPGSKTGQAQDAVGCIALPNGGLGPLPRLTSVIAPTHAPPANTLSFLNGLFIIGKLTAHVNTSPTQGDELIYGLEIVSSGPNRTFYLESIFVPNGAGVGGGASTTLVTLGPTTDVGEVNGVPTWNAMTGSLTMANATSTNLGLPTWLLAYYYYGTGTNPDYIGQPYQWNYPDPTNPTTATPRPLQAEASGYPADALTHQNRMVLLQYVGFSWGIHDAVLFVNEVFNYTEPPNSLTLGTQQETFIQENPVGVGAWGSINASELFLVKNTGGGYFIEGDLNNPTVIRLPGVTSTYGIECRGAQTPIGFVYASYNRGLWTWQGGSSSQKISNQLQDDFFMNPVFGFGGIISPLTGPVVDVCTWGDWIVVTNDWLMDTNTGGWWKLSQSPTEQDHLYYGVSWNGNELYASVPIPTSTVAIDVYSRNVPSEQYSWKSFPMRLSQGSKDRNYVIEAVVLRVLGAGTVEVFLTGVGDTSNVGATSPSEDLTFTSTDQPQMLMMRTGLVAQDVTIQIQSTGDSGGPAPIVYSVALGYFEQNPVSAT